MKSRGLFIYFPARRVKFTAVWDPRELFCNLSKTFLVKLDIFLNVDILFLVGRTKHGCTPFHNRAHIGPEGTNVGILMFRFQNREEVVYAII